MFTNQTLLITGGTGSFGSTVLKHFVNTDIGQNRIFSRDEKKRDDMRHELQATMPELAPKVKFFVGDVRNLQSVRDAEQLLFVFLELITWGSTVCLHRFYLPLI